MNQKDSSSLDNLKKAAELNSEMKLESESLYKSSYFPDSYKFPYNPDELARNNNYSIYDEMINDDQVKVALSLKKDMVLNTGWDIVCENEAVKESVKQNLEELGNYEGLESSFDDNLRDILSAYGYGFSLSEPIFRSPNQSESGKWELKCIKVRPPHGFTFNLDDKGTVLEIEQIGTRKILKFKPESFLHHVYQPEFGNPYGKSDLKAAFKSWTSKKFLFKMAMRYAERFAGALAVGRYTPNMTPGEISALSTALRSSQDNTTLVVPQDTQIELMQVARDSSDTYAKLLNLLNMWIGRSILVPDLMGVSGDKTDGGSQALGREQFKIFLSSIKNDKLALQKKITMKVIRPLVQVNFGDIPCSFEFKPIEAGEEVELLQLWLDAVNGKIFKPNEEEINHLRGKAGFPQGPVELIEEKPKEAPGELEVGDKEKKPAKKFSMRSYTTHEAKMDFENIERVLETSESRLSRELIGIVKKMGRDLMDQAASKGIIEKFQPERLKELKPRYQREMNDAIKGHFLALFRAGVEQAQEEIHGKEKKFAIAEEIFPDEFEEIIRADSFKLVGDISQDVLKRAGNILSDGLKVGASQGETVRKLMEELEDKTATQLHTIVRTRTTEVFNESRKTFFDTDPIAQDIIVGYQFSSIMDSRTSEVCARLDGRVFDKVEAGFLKDITPPLHFNCRSMLVPVTRFEQVSFNKPLSIDKLKDLGGNLIFGRLRDALAKA